MLRFSLMKSFLCHHLFFFSASPALAECLQRVPDESAGPAWTEGGEGVPRGARTRGCAGRKGASALIGAVTTYFIEHHLYVFYSACIPH